MLPHPTDEVNGSARDGASHGDARHRGQRLAGGAIELERGVAVGELARARADAHRDDALGIEAGGDLLQADEASHQQAGADQQHQRDRDFRDHEEAAQPAPAAAEAAFALRVPAARLERGVEIDARRAQRRREAEEDAGANRDGKGEDEHRGVEPNRFEPRDVARVDRPDDLQRDLGDRQAGGAAENAEQHALGQQLADEAFPARAERRPDGDLFLPAGGAGEQQIGDVGARDQQDERHGAEHDEHRDAEVADDGLDERDDVDRERAVAFVFLPDPRRDPRHVVPRLRHRHAWLQPRHQVVVFVSAPRDGVGAERQRQEHVHLTDARDRRHDLVVQEEVGPQDAGDLELVLRVAAASAEAVERDAGTDHIRVGAEGALPEAVAQDDDRRLAGRVFIRPQQPSVERLRAEQVEQAGGRQNPFDPLRVLAGQQRAGAALRNRHLLERSVFGADVDELPRRRPVLRDVDAWRSQPQHREPVRVGIRQRLEQQRVDDAEDGGVGADADGERDDDHQRQRGRAPQRPDGVAEVLQEGSH